MVFVLCASDRRTARTHCPGALFASAPASARRLATGALCLEWPHKKPTSSPVGLREGKGPLYVAPGSITLALYGVLATCQASNEFGRVLAAYGGVFIVGSLLWGVAFDGFHPDTADLVGAGTCLIGGGVIMYAR
jgi:small multidrug resistance family-3 protein